MNKLIPLLAFSVLLLVPASTPAFAQEIVGANTFQSTEVFVPLHGNADQSFTGPFTNAGTIGPFFPNTGQTFTPTQPVLIGADLFYVDFNNLAGLDTITINVWDGNVPGTGNLLGSASTTLDVTGSTVPNPIVFHVDYNPAIILVPGNTYSLEFLGVNGPASVVVGAFGDPYTGGLGYQSGNIIPDFDWGFVTYFEEDVVGGEFLPIDSTSLLLAGAQTFSWMIPVLLSGIGIGLFAVSRKSE